MPLCIDEIAEQARQREDARFPNPKRGHSVGNVRPRISERETNSSLGSGVDIGHTERPAVADYNGWEDMVASLLPSTSPSFSGFVAQNLYGREDSSSATIDSNIFPYCPQSLEFALPAFSFPENTDLVTMGQ